MCGDEVQIMESLTAYLKQIPEGKIKDTTELEGLLTGCWDEFVRDYGGMKPWKLLGRIEDVRWRYPILTFVIERHGGTVMGSTRANLQEWTVDIEEGTASCVTSGFRQLEPTAKALKVVPVVEELVQLIEEGSEDQRLKWSGDGQRVTVSLSKSIDIATAQQGGGSGYKQTQQGRSRRLKKALQAELEQRGWRSMSGQRPTFEKTSG